MRFKFGNNWLGYLKNISQEKIEANSNKLKEFLNFNLKGKTFLDVGSGSEVQSYAAVLENSIIHSFVHDVHQLGMVAFRPLIDYKKNRGMSIFHDLIGRIGGFPFEYDGFEKLKDFYTSKGFQFVLGNRATNLDCNKLLFKKVNIL